MTTPTTPQPRLFKIGNTRIVEDTSTTHLGVEEVRALLKVQFPEIAHATIRETTSADGQRQLEFLPIPGRKG